MLDTTSPSVAADTPDVIQHKTRRSYSKAFKRERVTECLEGDRSMAQIALSHGINANLLHKWVRQFQDTPTPQMVPVVNRLSPKTQLTDACVIELSLAEATVRFYGQVDVHSARAVIEALR